MASQMPMPGPPPPGGPSPQQIQEMRAHMAAEAAKRGMTPQQFQEMQRQQLAAQAAKLGMSPEQYVNQLRMQALQQRARMQAAAAAQQGGAPPPPPGAPQPGQMPGAPPGPGAPGTPPTPQQIQQMQQMQQQMQRQMQQQGQAPPQQMQQQVPVNPNAPKDPKAIAVAKFLKSQNLKPRTCILDGQRKDMFKVKRAIRALQSPAYQKASSKPNSLLPPVTDLASAENTFKLLPLSLLALRVTKSDPHEGHNHAKPKNRVKGLWTVKVEQQQTTDPMAHYIWLYEGPQWKQKVMAVGALVGIMAVIMFPLWPVMLRQGVWYLSVGCMGLLGLFFAMAIFRLILFCVTVFVVPPGLWLYPNLFEDVGFFDSFRPVWGWQEPPKKKGKKASKKGSTSAKALTDSVPAATTSTATESAPSTTEATTSSSAPAAASSGTMTRRDMSARVEEVGDDEE